MDHKQRVTVEFFGVPRARAGRDELIVTARTAAEALAAVECACPALQGLTRAGSLAPHYLLSINGERFVAQLDEPLAANTRLLLLSADAGG